MTDDPAQTDILMRTGVRVDGDPAVTVIPAGNGGNVLLPFTTLKLSLRLPPTCEAEPARLAVKKVLEDNPPYGATVEFDAPRGETGWNAPRCRPGWQGAGQGQQRPFRQATRFRGRRRLDPFMAMLGKKFPRRSLS